MSSWAAAASAEPVLRGTEGDLVWVRITVEPRLLEELLDALASVSFPINPDISHLTSPGPASLVEFPAYESRLDEVRLTLRSYGLDAQAKLVSNLFRGARTLSANPLPGRA